MIEGAHFDHRTGVGYLRLRVTCGRHVGCQRSRNCSMAHHLGMDEVWVVLGVWLREGRRWGRRSERLAHEAWTPSVQEIRAYLVEHGRLAG